MEGTEGLPKARNSLLSCLVAGGAAGTAGKLARLNQLTTYIVILTIFIIVHVRNSNHVCLFENKNIMSGSGFIGSSTTHYAAAAYTKIFSK